MSNARKANLEARLDHLRGERLRKEYSDDFAFSNGTIRRLDQQIAETLRQLSGEVAA